MRTLALTLILMAAFSAGCSRRHRDADPIARKAGHTAYTVAQESEKLAKKAGQKLKEASQQAHQGWKEASREDKAKNRR